MDDHLYLRYRWNSRRLPAYEDPQRNATQPNLNEVLRLIARRGGFLGRKSDREPGGKALWKGLIHVRIAEETMQLLCDEGGEGTYVYRRAVKMALANYALAANACRAVPKRLVDATRTRQREHAFATTDLERYVDEFRAELADAAEEALPVGAIVKKSAASRSWRLSSLKFLHTVHICPKRRSLERRQVVVPSQGSWLLVAPPRRYTVEASMSITHRDRCKEPEIGVSLAEIWRRFPARTSGD
ncbi:IS4 family transposase [Paraburkholderia humisilvae]|uniref:IS4 family transposase n=1 Tax=Paraburkholderia humisilvae TaxID=627669 RepID=UPI001FECC32E|nr:IS4 family transposase [Paraburkholderia humisilvae]